LIGPDAQSVVGEVPSEWLDEIGDQVLARWEHLVDEEHAEFMALTTCRVWRFAIERLHTSKTEAGLWALKRDPSLNAVDQALQQRGERNVTVEENEIRRLISLVRSELPRVGSGPEAHP
jgi:Domain of unknown function (DUF4111)